MQNTTAAPAADPRALSQNTYVITVAIVGGGEQTVTLYATSGDIARRRAARRPGVLNVTSMTRTHIKGRPVA